MLGAITGKDWTEQILDPLNQFVPPGPVFDAFFGSLTDIRNDIAATAVSQCSRLSMPQ